MPISVAIPPDLRGFSAALATVVKAALALERRTPGEIAIVLTDDADLRMLNRQWRGIDRATDVLSFSYDEDPPRRGKQVNGDLAVSLDRMRAQAKRFRVSEGRELARLVIHGALHLAGLDHLKADEREHMRTREEKALRGCRAAIVAIDKALAPKAAPTRRKVARAKPAAKRKPAKRTVAGRVKAAPPRRATPKRKPARPRARRGA